MYQATPEKPTPAAPGWASSTDNPPIGKRPPAGRELPSVGSLPTELPLAAIAARGFPRTRLLFGVMDNQINLPG